MLVTHDRYFLDNVAKWILELDRGQGIPWEGNYSSWLEQKQARLALEEKQESSRRKQLARELEWVRMSPRAASPRTGPGSSDTNNWPVRRREQARRRRRAPDSARSASWHLVVEAQDVAKGYGDNLLFEDMTFRLPPGGIIGVVAQTEPARPPCFA